ncbi:DinB family protein [Paenibacillus sp. KN14-4R]|uniref:DinB family protein n=1 Tax=Paenibacillus sp. KN14-4R TaxID=3445773 RepID=UPI003F9FE176
MNTLTTQILQQLEETTNHYLQEIDGFTMEQLTHVEHEDEWSLGQMYVHLVNSALYMQLRNADQCLSQSGDAVIFTGEPTEAWKTMQNIGGFPPIQIQVPSSPQYTPSQPESKEQIAAGLQTVLMRMKETAPKLEQANLQYKVAHPRLGPLHARDWFNLVEMHYRHHLLQEARLKSKFVTSSN